MSIYIMSSTNFKKLTLKYSYLVLEEEEVKDIIYSADKEIRKYIKENHPERFKALYENFQKKQEENKKENEPKQCEVKEIKNKDLKKIYRKIAAKIHPDKDGTKKNNTLFAEAAAAYKNNDMGKILEIAGLINIEVTHLSPESVKMLEKNVIEIEKKINNNKSTFSWKWHNTKIESEKEKIAQKLFQIFGA
jgi:hypothetical protein